MKHRSADENSTRCHKNAFFLHVADRLHGVTLSDTGGLKCVRTVFASLIRNIIISVLKLQNKRILSFYASATELLLGRKQSICERFSELQNSAKHFNEHWPRPNTLAGD